MPARLAVLLVALGASLARAETITVPPCGWTPGTTANTYTGLVSITASGQIFESASDQFLDPFYAFLPMGISGFQCPNCLLYNRESEGSICLCGDGCLSASHPVSDIVLGGYPAYQASHAYTVTLDLGAALPEQLHFAHSECLCGGGDLGDWTVSITAKGDKCQGAKLKAIGKKESALLGCQGRVAATGDSSGLSACEAKAMAKFSAAFAKAGICVGNETGNETACENTADGCRSSVAGAFLDAFPSPCEAGKRKAAGKLAKGELVCYAKAAATGLVVDSVCVARAVAKFSAAVTKAGACPDGGSPVSLIERSCVQPIVATGGGRVTDVCPTTTTTTPTSTTTTTTYPGCGAPDASGFCGGPCPTGSTCAATTPTTCGCVPDGQLCNLVEQGAMDLCGGFCPFVTDGCYLANLGGQLTCVCATFCGTPSGGTCPDQPACLPGRTCNPLPPVIGSGCICN